MSRFHFGSRFQFDTKESDDSYNDKHWKKHERQIKDHLKLEENNTNLKFINEGGKNVVWELDNDYILRLTKIDTESSAEENDIDLNTEEFGLRQQYEIDGCNNISKIYSYGKIIYGTTKRVYAIMDNLKGGDLSEYTDYAKPDTKKTSLKDTDQITIIIFNILKALQCINSKGFCHNDIKLENIMLEIEHKFSSVKLIDFGLMETCPIRQEYPEGTPGYMDWDTLDKECSVVKTDEKDKYCYTVNTDIWALGIVCLELLSDVHIKTNKLSNEETVLNGPRYGEEYYIRVNSVKNKIIESYTNFTELLDYLLHDKDRPELETPYNTVLEFSIFNEIEQLINKEDDNLPLVTDNSNGGMRIRENSSTIGIRKSRKIVRKKEKSTIKKKKNQTNKKKKRLRNLTRKRNKLIKKR
jgi:serine/threonine protein kinase